MVKIEEWDDQWTYGLCSSHHLSHHHNNSKKRHNNIKLIATTMKILSIRTINREYYKMPTFSASNRHWDATVTPYSTFKMIIFNCTNHYRCINYKIASLKLHRFLWCKAIFNIYWYHFTSLIPFCITYILVMHAWSDCSNFYEQLLTFLFSLAHRSFHSYNFKQKSKSSHDETMNTYVLIMVNMVFQANQERIYSNRVDYVRNVIIVNKVLPWRGVTICRPNEVISHFPWHYCCWVCTVALI